VARQGEGALNPVERALGVTYRPIVFRRVGSTNDVALDAAGAGAPPGLVVQAAVQSRGKGRSERDWGSPPGGLWMSILLEPDVPGGSRGLVPLGVGVACCRGLEELGVEARLRWPNDLMLDDAKLGGILVESASTGGDVQHTVAGIGLNVANDPPVEDGARVQDVASAPVREVREAILDRLEEVEQVLVGGGADEICNRFMRHAWGIGRELVLDGEPRIPREIAVDGALVVETPDGETEVHRSGSLRVPQGG
jgi:BirA family biotin operon repressor/biotin-[acetyl-CoA-carboxylase] ligase